MDEKARKVSLYSENIEMVFVLQMVTNSDKNRDFTGIK